MRRLGSKSRLFLPSLLLAFFCAAGALVKAQKLDNGCFVGEINSTSKGTEVVIAELGEALKEGKINKMGAREKYKKIDTMLEFPCRDLRKVHPNIVKFVYDGITYEVTEDKKEGTLLVITGAEGCSVAPYKKGIFPALNVWGGYEFKDATVEYSNGDRERTQYKNLLEPRVKVDQVIIKGHIKIIPEDFLVPSGVGVKNDNPYRERDGEPEYLSAGMTKVWRLDMSESDVEGIEFTALHNFGALKEVILPSHPVKVENAFWPAYKYEKTNGVPEDRRKTKLIGSEYIIPVGNIYEEDSCCSVQ